MLGHKTAACSVAEAILSLEIHFEVAKWGECESLAHIIRQKEEESKLGLHPDAVTVISFTESALFKNGEPAVPE